MAYNETINSVYVTRESSFYWLLYNFLVITDGLLVTSHLSWCNLVQHDNVSYDAFFPHFSFQVFLY